MATFDEAIQIVDQLPPQQRVELIDHIKETLERDAPPDAEFLSELRRRSQEVRDGAETIPWEEVKKGMMERMERRRKKNG